jgi:predicted nucleic-acid-binding protein
VVNFRIDSDNKNIKIELMLKGESDTLFVEIPKYQILEVDGKVYIDIYEIKTNREWLNIVIETYLKNKRVEVPKKFAPLLEIAL